MTEIKTASRQTTSTDQFEEMARDLVAQARVQQWIDQGDNFPLASYLANALCAAAEASALSMRERTLEKFDEWHRQFKAAIEDRGESPGSLRDELEALPLIEPKG